ncbi:MAG: PepSY domain-containing protein [Romboutsia sp.]|uniref:PepSY domain-containing protein n=1 Tax=Romboutsia sp. TaxID=1965302 RepID=UPI003F3800FB
MKKLLLITLIISASMASVACSNKTNENTKNDQLPQNSITIEEAKEIAIKHANVPKEEIIFLKAEEIMENGVKKYDIEFSAKDNKDDYEYEINVENGEILEYAVPEKQNTDVNTAKMSEDKAKEIALKHANLTSDKVTFMKSEYEVDNGVEKYNIDFNYDNKEYNYEIDVNSSEVISYEIDKK